MNKITVVGLGAGDLNQIPLGIYRLIVNKKEIYARTKEHPVIKELEREGILFYSFDSIYEEENQFQAVYERICNELSELAKNDDIVYAVPGHPMVAEKTVQLLLERSGSLGIEVEIAGGQSFLDALFQTVRFDPIEGFQLLDGTDFQYSDLRLTQHSIIGQVYDGLVASNVKLELLEILPADYEVFVLENAGMEHEKVRRLPIYLLDHNFPAGNLTSVYVPPVKDEEILYKDFFYLRRIIATLRGPNGCPWDKKQTHESLKKYLLEETYELFEAIDEKDDNHIVEELGDVLLQVMLHAQIGEDEGYFSINDVIGNLSEKMIHRHPHVFGNVKVESAEEVTAYWQEIKEKDGHVRKSAIEKIGSGMPAIMQAYKIQKEAAKFGFDWESAEPVMEKVREELQELADAMKKHGEHADIKDELGDLLFAAVNLARHLSIYPEEALIAANQKFIRRFKYVEQKLEEKAGENVTLEELDQYWNEAKKLGL